MSKTTGPVQTDKLLPISDAAQRLGRSVWTVKRMHERGHCPAVLQGAAWFIPDSFVAMVLSSPQPGRAGVLEDIAREWFAKHAPAEPVTV